MALLIESHRHQELREREPTKKHDVSIHICQTTLQFLNKTDRANLTREKNVWLVVMCAHGKDASKL